MKNETSSLGRAVGKTKGDVKKARHIKIQLRKTAGKHDIKGHRRELTRPVHQGGTFSSRHLVPKPRGASDVSRESVFGSL